MTKTISIARDFTVYPGGRTPEDGEFSGQEFREKFLVPAFNEDESVIVDLDGTRGYGSSFLEEAFGGLVRLGFSKNDIRRCIAFKSTRTSLINEINRYIDQAKH